MANGQTGDQGDLTKLIAQFLSGFGIVSILIVVIGRLWTLSYFDYFGLSTGDLEFTVADFAFRSLEVFIALGLAAIPLLIAARGNSVFRQYGPGFFVVELIVVASAGTFMWGVFHGWIPQYILARTGFLGVALGVTLMAMIFPVADIWFGTGPPGSAARGASASTSHPTRASRTQQTTMLDAYGERQRSRQTVASGLLGRLPRPLVFTRHEGGREVVRPVYGLLGRNLHRIIAAAVLMAIVFGYLPAVAGELATLEAKLDLKRSRLPVATLETLEDPLPDIIASDADPTRSNLVRVVLAQSDNTYVLESTQCTAVGSETRSPAPGADVCKVLAIPNRRIKSVEYRTVDGSPPPNDTPFSAERIALTEPFEVTVSTKGAGEGDGDDGNDIRCRSRKQRPFRSTVWYEAVPDTNGALVVTVKTLDEKFSPLVGVWKGSAGAVLSEPAPGSAPNGTACGTEAKKLPPEEHRELSATDGARRSVEAKKVATIANLEQGEHYFVGVGARERAESDVHVSIEFIPNASFLGAARRPPAPTSLPGVSLPAALGSVQLELRTFDTTEYDLLPLAGCKPVSGPRQVGFCVNRGQTPGEVLSAGRAVEFSLEPEEGVPVPFVVLADDPDSGPTVLEASAVLLSGDWKLGADRAFSALASLAIPPSQPELILALTLAPDTAPKSAAFQRLRFWPAALDPAALRNDLQLAGAVVLDQATFGSTDSKEERTYAKRVSPLNDGEVLYVIRALSLRSAKVQIQPVPLAQEDAADPATLANAAAAIKRRLEEKGLTKVEVLGGNQECSQLCIRIFLVRPPATESAVSDVLPAVEPPNEATPPPQGANSE